MSDESVLYIQAATAKYFGLAPATLLGKDRHKSVAMARHVAMYLCKKLLGRSFPELGREFGRRDHTTVMSAVRKVELLLKKDERVHAAVASLLRTIKTPEASELNDAGRATKVRVAT